MGGGGGVSWDGEGGVKRALPSPLLEERLPFAAGSQL